MMVQDVMTGKGKTVDAYIADCSESVRPLLRELRAFIHATMQGASEEMRYGAPYFLNAHGVPVIYLFGSKHHVNFGFLKSADLSDPAGVLKGSGAPSKHIKVKPGVPFDERLLTDFIRQCDKITS